MNLATGDLDYGTYHYHIMSFTGYSTVPWYPGTVPYTVHSLYTGTVLLIQYSSASVHRVENIVA